MLYITPLVLIYLRNLYILTIFIYCSPTPASDNHKFGLFFYEFVCLFLTYNGIQHHVSFGYTKLWFFFYIISKWSLSSVQLHSCVWLFATPWTSAHQASLSITNSQSLLKLMSVESVMPCNLLILCLPLLLLPSIFPSIRVFSNESIFRIMWPKYWNFSFSIHQSFKWIFRTDFL